MWRGMASGWLLAAAWTSRASTASHGLTRGPPALGIGSQGSSRSPQDPTRSNCFERRRIWCPRHLLRVLGFDSMRGKIRAPWPPIYRGFGLISKRILLRSRFDSSIESFSALVWITSKGKSLGMLRAWDELGRLGDGGSVTRPHALGQLGRSVACRASYWSRRWPLRGLHVGVGLGR
jgi:hypothetical protein